MVGFKGYRLILQINQKLALEDEKELVFLIVFVPMKFPLQNAEANDAIIHLTKGLIVPLLLAGGNEGWYVNQLEETELGIQVDSVMVLFFYGKPPCSMISIACPMPSSARMRSPSAAARARISLSATALVMAAVSRSAVN